MQSPDEVRAAQEPEDDSRPRWLLGLLPYPRDWYRIVMALGTGTVLMGGAIRALMPGSATWPREQFHLRPRERRFASAAVRLPEVELSRFVPRRPPAPAPALLRPEGRPFVLPSTGALPIRVLPAEAALPAAAAPRVGALPPESALPEPFRLPPNRRVPLGRDGVRPLSTARGRSILGGEEEAGSPLLGLRREPLIGAHREYENQAAHQVVGSQVRTLSAPAGSATPQGEDAWGGAAGTPARERLITGVRLIPERIELEAGTSQAYDLQIQLDRAQWYSVTHWPETRFRLLTGNVGIEQHRQADNVLLCLLDTPERLSGSQVLFEGSLLLPGRGTPLVARALVQVRVLQAERSEARRPALGSIPRIGR